MNKASTDNFSNAKFSIRTRIDTDFALLFAFKDTSVRYASFNEGYEFFCEQNRNASFGTHLYHSVLVALEGRIRYIKPIYFWSSSTNQEKHLKKPILAILSKY